MSPLLLLVVGCVTTSSTLTAEGLTVTLEEDSEAPVAIPAVGDDGAALTVTITTPPSHGVLEQQGGQWIYTPEPDYFGADAAVYQLDNGTLTVDADISITVTPVNDLPVADPLVQAALAGSLAQVALSAADVEGDPISWSLSSDTLDFSATEEGFEVMVREAGVHTVLATPADGEGNGEGVTVTLRVFAAEAGEEHAVVLDPDGTVWTFGSSQQGQVGDGQTRDRNAPVRVCTADDGDVCTAWLDGDFTAVSAGNAHTLALRSDGKVFGWGSDLEGQLLGVCSGCESQPLAVQLPISDVVDIGAGGEASYFVKSDGTVWAAGDNSHGQLGRGDVAGGPTPEQVCTGISEVDGLCTGVLSGIVDVDGGIDSDVHAAALGEDGRVYTWGDGDDGALGDACDQGDRDCDVRAWAEPVCQFWNVADDVCGIVLEDVESISVGEGYTLARTSDGRLHTWGDNRDGSLGTACLDGEGCQDLTVPAQVCVEAQNDACVRYIENVTSFAAGENHGLAVSDGTVWAWGEDSSGQTGQACDPWFADCPDVVLPVPVCAAFDDGGCDSGTLDSIAGVLAGRDSSYALGLDGTWWAWGVNSDGQLGDSSLIVTKATAVGQDTDWAYVGAGLRFSGGLKTDGRIQLWGSNEEGALGTGCSLVDDTCDVIRDRIDLVGPGAIAATNWVSLGIGEEFVVAVNAEGSAYAWGNNGSGQLGDGTEETRTALTPVVGDVLWERVFVGREYVLGVDNSGYAWAWGDGRDGQLANALGEDSVYPGAVVEADGTSRASNWAYFSADDQHTLALKTNGTLWAFGDGGSGQLGDGLEEDSDWPVEVLGRNGTPDTDWKRVAVGRDHSLAVKTDGTLWGWGEADDGKLATDCELTDTCEDLLVPVQIGTATDWQDVWAGDDHSFATKGASAALYAFGDDNDGALGIGRLGDAFEPTPVCTDFDATGACLAPLEGVTFVAVGLEHTFAITTSGSLFGWGQNCDRQLGIGGGCKASLPRPVDF